MACALAVRAVRCSVFGGVDGGGEVGVVGQVGFAGGCHFCGLGEWSVCLSLWQQKRMGEGGGAETDVGQICILFYLVVVRARLMLTTTDLGRLIVT